MNLRAGSLRPSRVPYTGLVHRLRMNIACVSLAFVVAIAPAQAGLCEWLCAANHEAGLHPPGHAMAMAGHAAHHAVMQEAVGRADAHAAHHEPIAESVHSAAPAQERQVSGVNPSTRLDGRRPCCIVEAAGTLTAVRAQREAQGAVAFAASHPVASLLPGQDGRHGPGVPIAASYVPSAAPAVIALRI